jgi:hypothetical protein
MLAILAIAASLILGCTYGRVNDIGIDHRNVHEFIDENFDALQASFSGIREKPGSIQFDIKNDNVVLLDEDWHPINERRELHELVQRMTSVYYRKYRGPIGTFGPQLYAILDVEGNKIGYLYTAFDLEKTTPIRQVGTNYRVDAITELEIRARAFRSDRLYKQSGQDKSF